MRSILISLVASAFVAAGSASAFDQEVLGKTFAGSGTWVMEGDVSGTWSSRVTMASVDRGILVKDEVKVDTADGVMEQSVEWLAEGTSSGFFKVLLVDRGQSPAQQQQGQQQQGEQQQGEQQQGEQQQGQQQLSLDGAILTAIGNGYCIEYFCHIQYEVNGVSIEENFAFKDGNLKRIGSMDLNGNSDKKTAWKSVLTPEAASVSMN